MEERIDYLDNTQRKLGKMFFWMLWSATIMQYILILLDLFSMFPMVSEYFPYVKTHKLHATSDTSTVYLISLGLYIGVKEWGRRLTGLAGIKAGSMSLEPKELGKRLEKGVSILILQFIIVLFICFLSGVSIIPRMPDELVRTFAQTGIGYVTTLGLKHRLAKKSREKVKNYEYPTSECEIGSRKTMARYSVEDNEVKQDRVIELTAEIEKLLMEKNSLSVKEIEIMLNTTRNKVRYAIDSMVRTGKIEASGITSDRKYKLLK